LVGVRVAGLSLEEQLEVACENVAWVAEQAQAQGATIMIEAVNSYENGPYLLDTTAKALDFLDAVGADNIALQYDVYHMQRMEGNIVATIREHAHRIGHIQVADSPDRTQPGSGELNYRFIFQAIAASGYTGAIGLEYNPRGSSEASFSWLPDDRRHAVAVDALHL